MDRTVYREPLLARIVVAVGFTCIDGVVLGSAIAAGGTPAAIASAGVFIALTTACAYRIISIAVIIDGDEVVVRNLYSTSHIRRDQVRGFGRGYPSEFGVGGGGVVDSRETITIDTFTESIPLNVFAAQQRGVPRPPYPSSAYHRRENALDVLSRWLRGEER